MHGKFVRAFIDPNMPLIMCIGIQYIYMLYHLGLLKWEEAKDLIVTARDLEVMLFVHFKG